MNVPHSCQPQNTTINVKQSTMPTGNPILQKDNNYMNPDLFPNPIIYH